MRPMQPTWRKPYNGKESSRRRLKDQFQGLMLQLEGWEVELGRNCKEAFSWSFQYSVQLVSFWGKEGRERRLRVGLNCRLLIQASCRSVDSFSHLSLPGDAPAWRSV